MKTILNPNLLVVFSFVLTNFCHGGISKSQSDDSQYLIVLSDATPQGIIHQTPSKKLENPITATTCHYLITTNFPDSIDKAFGISVGLLQMQANNQNSIKISTSTWSTSTSYSIVPRYEFKQITNKTCINFDGDWTNSTADLVLTVYSNFDNKKCPDGMQQCKCTKNNDDDSSSEEDDRDSVNEDRCIFSDMFCNGVSSCGVGCSYDESKAVCKKQGEAEIMEYYECGWGGFEYVFMMAMTGFLLILIPVIFLVILIYHRRFTSAGRLMVMRRSFDGNNNVEQDPNVSHVISAPPVYFDQPPSYDDLPEEVKVPRQQYQQTSGQNEHANNTHQNEISV